MRGRKPLSEEERIQRSGFGRMLMYKNILIRGIGYGDLPYAYEITN